jgi:hypothetical protein
MKMATFSVLTLALFMLAAACQQPEVTHKLVVAGNQHSVPLYPDENAYMVGNLGNKMVAKDIDPDTPVKIVSSDENGAVVQITAGPMKGQTGFVPKQNID